MRGLWLYFQVKVCCCLSQVIMLKHIVLLVHSVGIYFLHSVYRFLIESTSSEVSVMGSPFVFWSLIGLPGGLAWLSAFHVKVSSFTCYTLCE